jgi:hypothetical protein
MSDHRQLIGTEIELDNTVERLLGIGTAASHIAGEKLRQHAALRGPGGARHGQAGRQDEPPKDNWLPARHTLSWLRIGSNK